MARREGNEPVCEVGWERRGDSLLAISRIGVGIRRSPSPTPPVRVCVADHIRPL